MTIRGLYKRIHENTGKDDRMSVAYIRQKFKSKQRSNRKSSSTTISQICRSKELPDRSPAWTSEKITITRPATHTITPAIFLNLYFVFKNIKVRSMTDGIDQQSSSITLVIDVYWYAFTTAHEVNLVEFKSLSWMTKEGFTKQNKAKKLLLRTSLSIN